MSAPVAERTAPRTARAAGWLPQVLVLLVAALGVAGLVLVAPGRYGPLLAAGAVGLVAVVVGLASPATAMAYLLVAAFLRPALPSGLLPVDAFLLAFAGLLLAVALRAGLSRTRGPGVSVLGLLVAAYVGWNLFSIVQAHALEPVEPGTGLDLEVGRFVLVGTVMPLVVLLVARATLRRPADVRVVLGAVVGISGYSALVSILQFSGLGALVWPRYVLSNPDWPERATGVVAQPVVHGVLLVVGFLVAVVLASDERLGRARRWAAAVLAVACAYATYLTLTRSVWLGLAVAVLLGAVLARGWRTGFVATLGLGAVAVAVNWAAFSSGDRSSGGVGSSGEIQDRLNINATGVWATAQEPVTGWGVGRFPLVNTYFHRQLTPDVPWERGYAIAAHNDLLAVSSELGLVGAALWLAVVGLVTWRLASAVRRLGPAPEARLVLLGLLVLVTWLVSGLTVDQRFFDVSNLVVMAVVGVALGRASDLLEARRRATDAAGATSVGTARP